VRNPHSREKGEVLLGKRIQHKVKGRLHESNRKVLIRRNSLQWFEQMSPGAVNNKK